MKWNVQVSKISLVDLAGSERADSSGAKGTRLKVKSTGGPQIDSLSVFCTLHLRLITLELLCRKEQISTNL